MLNDRSLFFKSFPLIDMLAQHQNNKVSCGSWSYGKKDIAALKAILLLSVFQCLLWYLHVLHPTSKVHSQHRLDMGRGGHVCWQCWTDIKVVMVLAHNSLLYKLRTEEVN